MEHGDIVRHIEKDINIIMLHVWIIIRIVVTFVSQGRIICLFQFIVQVTRYVSKKHFHTFVIINNYAKQFGMKYQENQEDFTQIKGKKLYIVINVASISWLYDCT